MSEPVFEPLVASLEKRDLELGRTPLALNLQRDARYRNFENIVRIKHGKEPLDTPADGGSSSALNEAHATQRTPQRASAVPSSSQARRSVDLSAPTNPAKLKTGEDEMELIDLLDDDDDITPSLPIPTATERIQPSKLPRLFDDEDETVVLDTTAASQSLEKSCSSADPSAAKTTGKRRTEQEQENQSPKRRRTKKPPKEARGHRYRSAPAKWILDRMERSNQRLCLVRSEDIGEAGVVLDVMGTNGNVYKVTIALHPTCTCRDFTGRAEKGKHGPCKHLIFAFRRVFKLEDMDPRWWQTRLVPSELKDLLEKRPAHLADGVMADESVQQQLEAMRETAGSGRRKVEGDCPVCFEDLLQADGARPEDVSTFCKKCGHNFHKVCLDKWIKAQPGDPTCPLCRQSLQMETQEKQGGFVNLAAYSSAHERQLTLAEMYRDTHQYIGTSGGSRGRGRGPRR